LVEKKNLFLADRASGENQRAAGWWGAVFSAVVRKEL
jgi:hypothetical protein